MSAKPAALPLTERQRLLDDLYRRVLLRPVEPEAERRPLDPLPPKVGG
jgi:hypothetical protein